MKSYVIDSNVIFSATISGKEIYKNLFIDNKFFLPDFALTEIEKYKEMLLKKTKLKDEKIKDFTIFIFSKLTVVPNFLLSKQSILKAYELCKNIDEKDTMYVALSIELKVPFVTRDKKLHDYLKEHGFDSIIMFDTLFTQ
jgi:predicted nucleic acid-binding protein